MPKRVDAVVVTSLLEPAKFSLRMPNGYESIRGALIASGLQPGDKVIIMARDEADRLDRIALLSRRCLSGHYEMGDGKEFDELLRLQGLPGVAP